MIKHKGHNIYNFKVIIKNFGHLSFLKLLSILLPLATYPYLIRVLGANVYGTIIFVQSAIVYFTLVINFGFNLYGAKIVAENSRDNKRLSEIFSSITIIKLFLFTVTTILLVVLILVVPKVNQLWLLFLICYIVTLEEIIFPQWYFLGVDKLKYLTAVGVISKIVFTALIFMYVKKETDDLLVPIFQGTGVLISGIISGHIIFYKEKINMIKPPFNVIKKIAAESFPLFISSSSKQIYVNANRIIIGSIVGMNEVSYYDLAEKILNVIKLPAIMLVQAAFPTFSRNKKIDEINKLMTLGVSITILLMLFTYAFSSGVIELLGSKEMLNTKGILNILLLSALFVSLSQFLGNLRLVVFGHIKKFSQIMVNSVIFYLAGALVLYTTRSIDIYSLSWIAVITEIYVTSQMLLYIVRNKLLL